MQYQIIEVAPDGTETVLQTVNSLDYAVQTKEAMEDLNRVEGCAFRVGTVAP